METIALLKEFGPYVAAIAYFIWQSGLRETSLKLIIDKNDDYIRNTLSGVVIANTLATTALTAQLTRMPCQIAIDKPFIPNAPLLP